MRRRRQNVAHLRIFVNDGVKRFVHVHDERIAIEPVSLQVNLSSRRKFDPAELHPNYLAPQIIDPTRDRTKVAVVNAIDHFLLTKIRKPSNEHMKSGKPQLRPRRQAIQSYSPDSA